MALLFVRSHIKIHEQNIIYEHLCMHGFGRLRKRQRDRTGRGFGGGNAGKCFQSSLILLYEWHRTIWPFAREAAPNGYLFCSQLR